MTNGNGRLRLPPPDSTFVAIDFETADYGADSACAVGLVRVEDRCLVHREVVLIRPPRQYIRNSYIHGITWPMVRTAPAFVDAWPRLTYLLEGANFLAAHNASFDQRVLNVCCAAAGIGVPELPFLCTVQLARRTWKCSPATLPAVCRRLGIGLNHHEAGSDAEACARIVLAATMQEELFV